MGFRHVIIYIFYCVYLSSFLDGRSRSLNFFCPDSTWALTLSLSQLLNEKKVGILLESSGDMGVIGTMKVTATL